MVKAVVVTQFWECGPISCYTLNVIRKKCGSIVQHFTTKIDDD